MNRLYPLSLLLLMLTACEPNNGFKNPQENVQTPATQADNHEVKAALTPADNQAFLVENQKKDGVKTTASGLQYIVVKEGQGKQPKATDIVSVEYTGKLIDGTVFDSTNLHGGNPIEFPLNQVIAGWTEGLQLMKEGAEYTFFIPSELAYGEQGASGVIPPHSTLIFDVKLVKVH